MAGWRTFQRGHASLPAAFPSPVSRTWKRPIAGLGALVSVALLALLFSSCVARDGSSGVALEPVNLGSAAQASTSTAHHRVHHVPGQENYADTQISPQYGERWFCSEAEAREAGWRKAGR